MLNCIPLRTGVWELADALILTWSRSQLVLVSQSDTPPMLRASAPAKLTFLKFQAELLSRSTSGFGLFRSCSVWRFTPSSACRHPESA